MISLAVRLGVLGLVLYVIVTFFSSRLPQPVCSWVESIDLPYMTVRSAGSMTPATSICQEPGDETPQDYGPERIADPPAGTAPDARRHDGDKDRSPEWKYSLGQLILDLQAIEGMADALGKGSEPSKR